MRLLMVMPYPRFVRSARREGIWICSVWDPTLAPADQLREVEALSDAYVVADFGDDQSLRRSLREAAARYDVDVVYHAGREDSMLTAVEVAEELGRSPNPSRAIHALNDKLAMRELLRSHGLSPVRFAAAAGVAEVRRVVQAFGQPAIVKPTALSGSRGVRMVRGPADLEVWERLIAVYGCPGPFLVEEPLAGEEFSVETLSRGGEHHVVGLTRKHLSPPPLFVEMGHTHPADLAEERRTAIAEAAVGLLRAADYRFGPAHTEVIWTAAGPRVVESQARQGGDHIPRLVELATGIDMDRAMFRMLLGDDAPPRCTRGRVARIAFLGPPAGVVESVSGLDEARRQHGVEEIVLRVSAGARVGPLIDSRSRPGHVIVTADTHEEARRRLEAALALLRVVVRP
jgi:biotin carboxylase